MTDSFTNTPLPPQFVERQQRRMREGNHIHDPR
jgi:hypothetical protein